MATVEKFSAALTMIGTNEKAKAANRRAIRTSITDNSNAVDVFAVLEDAGFEWNGSEWVEKGDSDDPLTDALLEGDGKALRQIAADYERLMDENYSMDNDLQLAKKMLQKVTAERDELKAMLLRSEERAANLSDELYAAENDPVYVRRDMRETISDLEKAAQTNRAVAKRVFQHNHGLEALFRMLAYAMEMPNPEVKTAEKIVFTALCRIFWGKAWKKQAKFQREIINSLNTDIDAVLRSANDWIGFRERLLAQKREGGVE